MIRWRLYYADGSTYSNEDGAWEDAPSTGVVILVVRDPTETWGRWVMSGYAPPSKSPRGNDHYVKRPDSNEPWATDHEGRDLFIAEGHPEACIKDGQNVDSEVWQEIQKRAVDDPDFPRHSPRRRSTDWN